MTNRIDSYLDTISKKVRNYSILPKFEEYYGEDFNDFIQEYIKRREQQARMEGAKEAVDKLVAIFRKRLDVCIQSIFKIVEVVNEVKNENLKDTDFDVSTTRINVSYDNLHTDVLFIINSDIGSEIKFSRLLSNIETSFLKLENVSFHLTCLNERNKELDITSIEADFPVILTPHKK